MSTAFHPQTDGATERANGSVSQVLRALARPDQKDWARKIPLVEFALNASANSSTGYAPFELTGGYMPRMFASISSSELPGVRNFAQRARDTLLEPHDAIIESRVIQTCHANKRRRDESRVHSEDKPLEKGDLVYLSTKNLNLPKGRANKLLPKYLGPYRIIRANTATSNYTIELPEDLARRRVHPTFHFSKLRRHEPNDDSLFPHRETRVYYDIGTPANAEWLVEEILDHRWKRP